MSVVKSYLWLALLCLLSLPTWANQLKSIRVAPTQDRTRVVIDLSSAARYKNDFSEQPARVTIDLKGVTTSLMNPERLSNLGPVIRSIRSSMVAGDDVMRLVFELNTPVRPQIFSLTPQAHYGYRLVLDFDNKGVSTSPGAATANRSNASAPAAKTSPSGAGVIKPVEPLSHPPAGLSAEGQQAHRLLNTNHAEKSATDQSKSPFLVDQNGDNASSDTSAQTAKAASAAASKTATPAAADSAAPTAIARNDKSSTPRVLGKNGDQVVIAIDAGHGGKDPGAIGPRGTHEKNVTLAIARELAAQINRQPGMKAVLTRNGDYFVDLNARSEIARKQKAQLLISIHADSIDNPSARGASVWILSNKRVDKEMNKLLDQQDKHTELLGGAGKVIAESEPNPYLAQTILDLSWDNSRSEGYNIGESVLSQIGRVARLHKNKPVHASLAVLKAPDIPSLLIETGFISNGLEEKQLASSSYQRQLASAIFRGVQTYYASNAPKNTQMASRAGAEKRHVVVAGESLSGVAQKYGVSKQKLREQNNLKSEQLLVGQVLRIPAS